MTIVMAKERPGHFLGDPAPRELYHRTTVSHSRNCYDISVRDDIVSPSSLGFYDRQAFSAIGCSSVRNRNFQVWNPMLEMH